MIKSNLSYLLPLNSNLRLLHLVISEQRPHVDKDHKFRVQGWSLHTTVFWDQIFQNLLEYCHFVGLYGIGVTLKVGKKVLWKLFGKGFELRIRKLLIDAVIEMWLWLTNLLQTLKIQNIIKVIYRKFFLIESLLLFNGIT